MIRAVIRALVFTAVIGEELSGQSGPVPNAQAPEILSVGRGDTTIAPTSAAFSVSVTTRAPTAAQAAAENAKRLESTLRWLRSLGLAPTDLTTVGYSVDQHYEEQRGRRTSPGFIARNTVRVEVRRLEDLGRVIDAALSGGATEISAPQFLSTNVREARRAALAEALREARADAEAIARAAGGALGRLIMASSGVSTPMYREAYGEVVLTGATAGGMPTNIMPRDLTITALVTVRWEFVPRATR
jgi:uncharacterized protein YggE